MAETEAPNNVDRRWERERRELLELIDTDFVATAGYTGRKTFERFLNKPYLLSLINLIK